MLVAGLAGVVLGVTLGYSLSAWGHYRQLQRITRRVAALAEKLAAALR